VAFIVIVPVLLDVTDTPAYVHMVCPGVSTPPLDTGIGITNRGSPGTGVGTTTGGPPPAEVGYGTTAVLVSGGILAVTVFAGGGGALYVT
jgi:hypothetical protein